MKDGKFAVFVNISKLAMLAGAEYKISATISTQSTKSAALTMKYTKNSPRVISSGCFKFVFD